MEPGDCPPLNINAMRAISVKSFLNALRLSACAVSVMAIYKMYVGEDTTREASWGILRVLIPCCHSVCLLPFSRLTYDLHLLLGG